MAFAPSAVALAVVTLVGPVLAQSTPPDSGGVLRELQQITPRPLPRHPALQRYEESEDGSPSSVQPVNVKSITISGNTELPTAELMPLVAELQGKEVPLGRLHAAARRITRYYRENGFPVARAFLPAQDVTDGRVIISVVEGRISSHKVTNKSLVSDERVNAFLEGIKDGDVVRGNEIDRGLLLLQDTPGVGASRATLQPGASPGTSELVVEVDPSAPYSGNVVVDNSGSRYTGEYRVSGAFTMASPLKLGDQLGVSGLTSGSGLRFARLAYQLPVGSSGLRVGAAYFNVNYKLGHEFAALEAHGSANSSTVYGSYPIIRSQLRNLNATLSYENKSTVDYVDATSTVADKKLKITALGLNGNLQDSFGSGGITAVDVAYSTGKLDIQSPAAQAVDAASAHTNGSFGKLSWSLSRLQRITDKTQVWVVLAGQQARKNLDSSEKFSLGGAGSIRAYPTGEASGDEGHRGTVEVRYDLHSQLQALAFYDFGSVTINKTPFGTAANSRTLAGAGFGLNAYWDMTYVKAALAWKTRGGAPVSVPASAVKSPTLTVQAGVLY